MWKESLRSTLRGIIKFFALYWRKGQAFASIKETFNTVKHENSIDWLRQNGTHDREIAYNVATKLYVKSMPTTNKTLILDAFASADVAIEFTNPTAAYGNYLKAFSHNVKVVSGSRGGWKTTKPTLKHWQDGKQTLFWASNFSISVAIFSTVNRYLAKIMNQFPQYDVTMEERFTTCIKLDAPSGTAITLAEEIIDHLDRKNKWVKGLQHHADGTEEGNNAVGSCMNFYF